MSSHSSGRPPTQRLFAAVLPPAEAVAELRTALAPLHALPGSQGLRWTRPADWHFTLAFYGEVPEDVLPELSVRLERAAHRTETLPLRIHGAGHFGGRALWAGAAGGLDMLRLLAERADAAARRAGLPMEEHRRYSPHLTLARSRRAEVDLRPFTAALAGFEGRRWEVEELTLVRSNLPDSGVPGERPGYEEVRAWPLGR
ncbi:RNA 2',3'-cyclic phosphodiesterase [Streptomyces sp. WZ.A104]|uniref:RNA 2',3'-cyclic phosphodiesterase n=1 Tax=Streptomyces sp. WZ.A104 TaxID=2023771 RepID=UPI000BBB76EC|nr:RNA 2',3'-cyclic phosphodiesterase [Streptomyces sp. WZ.A104]PCG82406.1 RNA 2',3'-cyclic phosphodiesterase [Streptomyces sp. WZ.A104]